MNLDLVHRVPRFFGSIRPGPPGAADVAWAESFLNPGEVKLFRAMSNPDKRHAVRVARRVEVAIDAVEPSLRPASKELAVTAGLLHDVGKNLARLGTYGRVVATVSGAVGGLDLAEVWQSTSGFTRKVGLYLRYNVLGVDLLEVAGSDATVIAWSLEHHLPEESWTVPVDLGRMLAAADE